LKTVAFYTLGCKVNQYDSQAMLELFERAGYQSRPFREQADVYVVNTCVVTGEGERKSLQAVRRALKMNPRAAVVLSGCLAQKEAEALLPLGVRLVLGNHRRQEVVTLLEEALATDTRIAAVEGLRQVPFEELSISRAEGHTRAVLKIQEGCDRWCAYCIIPSVRGGIRSRPVAQVGEEAARLAEQGYQEVVLTGIHLSSYGRDLQGQTLPAAVAAVAAIPGIRRIRLGSLEPVAATEDFVQALAKITKVCPQFHLSMQSGSDTVLRRMRRRYTSAEYLVTARRLQQAFPGCALTTDVLCGFPGETEEEAAQTLDFCRRVGFARMHVFPFSPRAGTMAADMEGQLSRSIKMARARSLISLGEELAAAYRRSLIGSLQPVLFETAHQDGALGYTPQYVECFAKGAQPGQLADVLLKAEAGDRLTGVLKTPNTSIS
jgi:threonylcarbamoyladenosine tRNA methylthiotransferase MtaB